MPLAPTSAYTTISAYEGEPRESNGNFHRSDDEASRVVWRLCNVFMEFAILGIWVTVMPALWPFLDNTSRNDIVSPFSAVGPIIEGPCAARPAQLSSGAFLARMTELVLLAAPRKPPAGSLTDWSLGGPEHLPLTSHASS